MSWWHISDGLDQCLQFADSCADWEQSLNGKVGGKLVLKDGAEFGASRLWWGRQKKRHAPHEGVDIHEALTCTGVHQLPVGFGVPAIADGVVVGIFEDFLAKSVVIQHLDTIQVPSVMPGQQCK